MQGCIEESLRDFNEALLHCPDDVNVLLRVAEMHTRLGSIQAARRVLSRVAAAPALEPPARAKLDAKRERLDALCDSARSEWAALRGSAAAGDSAGMTAAVARAASALRERPRFGELALLQAAAALWRGDWDVALRLTRAAAATHAGSAIQAQAWWLQCDVLFAQGDLQACADLLAAGASSLAAVEDAVDVVVSLPTAAAARARAAAIAAALEHRKRGTEQVAAERLAEAERAYTAALSVAEAAAPPFCAKLYHNRAVCLQVQIPALQRPRVCALRTSRGANGPGACRNRSAGSTRSRTAGARWP